MCSAWITHLFNFSLDASWITPDWKIAIIHPVPKLSSSQNPSDYRLISVVPVLSRMLERFVVHGYLYPSMPLLHLWKNIRDQYSFGPLDRLLLLLPPCWRTLQECYYQMNTSCWWPRTSPSRSPLHIGGQAAAMDIPDNIYNWIVNYFDQRGHVTGYNGL